MWALLLALVMPSRAATWPDLARPPAVTADGAQDAALVIGIEDYAFAQDLPGARTNALAWVSYLQARSVPLVKPLLDAQATREEILMAARQAAARTKPNGTFWLVYIGHGAPSRTGDDGLLIGMDALQTPNSLEARGLPQRELVAAIEGSLPTGARAVLIVDACFSGKTASGDLAPGLAPLKPVLARLDSTRTTSLTAASSDEYAGALPDGSRPAFSYLMLGALRGWGDGNGDGRVSASEALAYTETALVQTVTGRSQTPTLSGDGSIRLSTGKEKGPDLVAMSIQSRGPDIDALLAAQIRRREAEQQEKALLVRIRTERESKLVDAVKAKRAEASALWARMAPLLAVGGPEAKTATEGFIEAWAEEYVELVDAEGVHRRAVAPSELSRARFWLAQYKVTQGAGGAVDHQGQTPGLAQPESTVHPAEEETRLGAPLVPPRSPVDPTDRHLAADRLSALEDPRRGRVTRRVVGLGLAGVGTASLVTGQVWRANAVAIAGRGENLVWGDQGTALAVNLATVGGLGLMAGGGGLVVSAGFGGRQTSVGVAWSW